MAQSRLRGEKVGITPALADSKRVIELVDSICSHVQVRWEGRWGGAGGAPDRGGDSSRCIALNAGPLMVWLVLGWCQRRRVRCMKIAW